VGHAHRRGEQDDAVHPVRRQHFRGRQPTRSATGWRA
jgi:hypothetical protein